MKSLSVVILVFSCTFMSFLIIPFVIKWICKKIVDILEKKLTTKMRKLQDCVILCRNPRLQSEYHMEKIKKLYFSILPVQQIVMKEFLYKIATKQQKTLFSRIEKEMKDIGEQFNLTNSHYL